jgi:heterodisulfide reductase subunit A
VSRIGVFICHCGENIARTVDCAGVADALREHPGVAVATDYKYMCSDPGQQLIKKAIEDNELTGVVVCACSPHMHEKTFRRAAAQAGLNPFVVEMANIREHCSWIHDDVRMATEKAKALVAGAVRRVALHQPLEPMRAEVNPNVLVVGGGITGIQAALEIAESGTTVYLVERDASIGGRMGQFDKTFPTLDCAACILTPKMVSVGHRENIKLLSYSEVVGCSGYIGNFKVKVKRKARFVDESKCTGCGLCWNTCPATRVPAKRTIRLGDQVVKQVA